MRFVPSYKLEIISEENFCENISLIEQRLNEVKVSGSFNAFDGIKIHYEYFLAENSRASVVVVHGLSEFTRKFYEFIFYCLNSGLNVFIFDQRCHGLSDRLTDKITLLHVDDFEDYVKDLAKFIDEIVLKIEDKPLYLYAHSMGGAISALYLAKHSQKIKKAVFTAPMFEPVVENVPFPIARGGVLIGKLFCGGKRKFVLTKEFDPDVKYNESLGSSRARFEHNIKMRRENPSYQSTPMTFGWVYNSLIVGRKIFRKRIIDKITTPILLISAEKDRTVRNAPQFKFANICKSCRLISIKGATHALLAGDNETVGEIMKQTLDFLRD